MNVAGRNEGEGDCLASFEGMSPADRIRRRLPSERRLSAMMVPEGMSDWRYLMDKCLRLRRIRFRRPAGSILDCNPAKGYADVNASGRIEARGQHWGLFTLEVSPRSSQTPLQ